MTTQITSSESLFRVYSDAYFQTRGKRLNIDESNFESVLKENYDYLFIRGLILEIEEKSNNHLKEIQKVLKDIIEYKKVDSKKKVSLLEQIKSEGYSFDFSDFEPLPNSILFS